MLGDLSTETRALVQHGLPRVARVTQASAVGWVIRVQALEHELLPAQWPVVRVRRASASAQHAHRITSEHTTPERLVSLAAVAAAGTGAPCPVCLGSVGRAAAAALGQLWAPGHRAHPVARSHGRANPQGVSSPWSSSSARSVADPSASVTELSSRAMLREKASRPKRQRHRTTVVSLRGSRWGGRA